MFKCFKCCIKKALKHYLFFVNLLNLAYFKKKSYYFFFLKYVSLYKYYKKINNLLKNEKIALAFVYQLEYIMSHEPRF